MFSLMVAIHTTAPGRVALHEAERLHGYRALDIQDAIERYCEAGCIPSNEVNEDGQIVRNMQYRQKKSPDMPGIFNCLRDSA